MKKNSYILFMLVILSIAILQSEQTMAQQMTSRGKDFWLGFVENYDRLETPTLSIFISSTTGTSGKIEMPLAGYSRNFIVGANTTLEIQVPPNVALVTNYGAVMGQGIHVSSNDPVTVYALNYMEYTSDASLILPVQTIGSDYIVQAYNENFNSYVLIVATANNTNVEITPNITTLSNNRAGVPFRVILNAGQCYYVKSQKNQDLSGTRVKVVSGNPVSVFGGSTCTTIGGNGTCCCNHLLEQIYPIKKDGMMEYITVPYKTRKGDLFRLTAFGDTTSVTFDNLKTKKIKPFSYFDTTMSQPCYIKSNKPLSIAQYSKSWETDNVNEADPFYIMLSSFEMTLDVITFNAFRTAVIESGGNYYLNIITPTSGIAFVTLDGNSITNDFKPVRAYPDMSYAQLTISSGDHTLRGGGGLIAYIYGYANREAYGYAAGVNIQEDLMETVCPDKIFNNGDTLVYPLQVKKNYSILTDGSHTFQASLSFNGNLLSPILDSTMTYDNASLLSIKETIQDVQLPANLKNVKFTVMLGDSECTTLRLEKMSWDGYTFTGQTDCRICSYLCEADGKRLILSTPALWLGESNPNPCSTTAYVEYQLRETGDTELSLYDTFGRKTDMISSGSMTAGKHNATVNVASKSPGTYFLVLKTNTETIVKKLIVVR